MLSVQSIPFYNFGLESHIEPAIIDLTHDDEEIELPPVQSMVPFTHAKIPEFNASTYLVPFYRTTGKLSSTINVSIGRHHYANKTIIALEHLTQRGNRHVWLNHENESIVCKSESTLEQLSKSKYCVHHQNQPIEISVNIERVIPRQGRFYRLCISHEMKNGNVVIDHEGSFIFGIISRGFAKNANTIYEKFLTEQFGEGLVATAYTSELERAIIQHNLNTLKNMKPIKPKPY
jgi:hypothetical protein